MGCCAVILNFIRETIANIIWLELSVFLPSTTRAFGEVSSFKWLASFESVVLLAKFIFHGWNRVPQSLYSMRFAAACNWWNGVTCNERETSRTAVASESHTCISPESTQSLLFQWQLYELSIRSLSHSLFGWTCIVQCHCNGWWHWLRFLRRNCFSKTI